MRSIIAIASLAALLLAVGCNIAPHRRDNVVGGAAAKENATPTADKLVKYLNDNAKLIAPTQALASQNVNVIAQSVGGGGGIDCKMICQAPRNFYFTGVTFGQPMVDIGSNDKEFWFWSKQINPPYLYHCSYDDLAHGVKVPFPIQPEMVLTALGLAQYDPSKNYQLRIVNDNRGQHKTIEMTEQTRSLDNKPIQKVTVFNYYPAQPPQPQVVAHILRDEQGKPICVANVRYAQRVGANGPIIPKMIDFEWPEQKLKMSMRIENPSLTTMTPERIATVFNRQSLHYQAVDLATQTMDGAGVQQAGIAAPTTYRR
ncbi:MAG: hypothetical protein ACYC3I_25960 [Gemmataceae bacterium]